MTTRVAVVVTSTEAGGAEAYLTDLYTHPVVAGEFPATLLGSFPGWESTGLPARDMGLGVKWGYSSMLRSARTLPAVLRRGREAIRDAALRDGAGLFHMQYKREQVLYTRHAARFAPVVWTEHGQLPGGRLRVPLLAAYRHAAARLTGVICVSHAVREEVADAIRNPRVELVVIESSIDPAWLLPPNAAERRAARAAFGVEDDRTLVVASVGRLVPLKRTDLLVAALAHLPQDSVLLISGVGPERAALEAIAAGDPRVRLLGRHPDARDLYRAADVAALPSRSEGFPVVALEAASAGCPLVVVADGGFASVVDGWGVVAGAPDPREFARAIVAARDLPREPPRTWAEAHSRDAWARAHTDALRRFSGR